MSTQVINKPSALNVPLSPTITEVAIGQPLRGPLARQRHLEGCIVTLILPRGCLALPADGPFGGREEKNSKMACTPSLQYTARMWFACNGTADLTEAAV